MNPRFLLLIFTVFLSCNLVAQLSMNTVKYTVVMWSGDSITCDELSVKENTIICKSEGQKKVKLQASDVKYYVEDYKKLLRDELPPPFVDTTQKYFVDDIGRIHAVWIENDSFYLSVVDTLFRDKPHAEYYVHYKHNNQEVVKIKQDKYALNVLVKYFGGVCAEFDKSIEAAQPDFKKKGFIQNVFADLVWNYHRHCSP